MSERQVCLVTGGASGIGEACVRAFAARGHAVVIADIQDAKAAALAAAIAGEPGAQALALRLDVREERDFERAMAAVTERWGRLDVMVNNAAIVGALGPIASLPVEEWDHSQAVILRSVFLGMKHAARLMTPRGEGAIVNIASAAGLVGGYGPHIYNACKAAVVQLTKSVSLELIEQGIRVNAVCPGNVETPIHTGVTDERWKARMAKIREEHVDDQPLPRMGLPEEIADAVAWLASAQASYVSGHALVVDGGLLAGRPWRLQPAFMRELHPGRR
jgi:NAD(P)-dependent dehydrogenase (short-subunit alcohol dehydrogenase family)